MSTAILRESLLTTTWEVIEMGNIKNILIENEALQAENEKLRDELTYFKARNYTLIKQCQRLANRNQKLECKVADLEFSRNFLNVPSATEEVMVTKGDDF